MPRSADIVAFIPARGGSKRLPGKNVRVFDGHPLIAHSIAAATSSQRVGRCVVSTDDADIAAVAVAYGAAVIPRPASLAVDEATTASAARHAVDWLTANGARPAVLVTLQPTCPLRPPSLIDQALDMLASRQADSVVAVTRTTLKLGRIDDGWFAPAYPVGIRSQDMHEAYFENGVIYVSHVDTVMTCGNLFGERVMALEIDPLFGMADIDTEMDFKVAEFLHQQYRDRFVEVTGPHAHAMTAQ
jgi:N-acylneuraminate cytidylyltransferase